MRMRLNRPQCVLLPLLLVLTVYFWTQSRYPSLMKKLATPDRVEFNSLSFRAWVPLLPEDTMPTRVLKQSLNWYEANWRGMTFGFLLAAGALAMFRLRRRDPSLDEGDSSPSSRQSSWGLGAGWGTLIGAPLGLCTNCSVPLARATLATQLPASTAFAIVMVSPTLNPIALEILWQEFGPVEFSFRLLGTLLLLIMMVQVLKWLPPRRQVEAPVQSPEPVSPEIRWGKAVTLALRTWLWGLGQVLIWTLPAMLATGVLGGPVIELAPLEAWAKGEIHPVKLAAFSLVTALLPVPMTFDLAFANTLKEFGVSPIVYMTALMNLGTLSLFSLWVLWRAGVRRASVIMLGLLLLIGPFIGWSLNQFQTYRQRSEVQSLRSQMLQAESEFRRELESLAREWLSSEDAANNDALRKLVAAEISRRIARPEFCTEFTGLSAHECDSTQIELEPLVMVRAVEPYYLRQACQNKLGKSRERCEYSAQIAELAGQLDPRACLQFQLEDRRKLMRTLHQECWDRMGWHLAVDMGWDCLGRDSRIRNGCKIARLANEARAGNTFVCPRENTWLNRSCVAGQATSMIRSFQIRSFAERGQLVSHSVTHKSSRPMITAWPSEVASPSLAWESIWENDEFELWRQPMPSQAAKSALEPGELLVHPGRSRGLAEIHDVRSIVNIPALGGSRYALPIASIDFNADGWPDLASIDVQGLTVAWNLGGTFLTQHLLPQTDDPPALLTFTPFDRDRDGDWDLLVVARDGRVWTLMAVNAEAGAKAKRPHWRWQPEPELEKLMGRSAPRTLATSDLDGDGHHELIWLSPTVLKPVFAKRTFVAKPTEDGGWVEFDGDGAGRGSSAQDRVFRNLIGSSLTVLTEDLNADGAPDILIGMDSEHPDAWYLSQKSSRDKSLSWRRLEGSQTQINVPATSYYSMSYDSADLNADGRPDLLMMDLAADPTPDFGYCESLGLSEAETRECQSRLKLAEAARSREASPCFELAHLADQIECAGISITRKAGENARPDWCPLGEFDRLGARTLCLNFLERGRVAGRLEPGPTQVQRNVLLISQKSAGLAARWRDESARTGVQATGWAWNSRFVDIDNDGNMDLLIGTGRYQQDQHGLNRLFIQTPREPEVVRSTSPQFTQASPTSFRDPVDTPSFAIADFDLDGRLDAVATGIGVGKRYYENRWAKSPGLSLEVMESRRGHSAPIDLKAQLRVGDRVLHRQIRMSGGHQSFDWPGLWFGLGENPRAEGLEVRWSDGQRIAIPLSLNEGFRYRLVRRAKSIASK